MSRNIGVSLFMVGCGLLNDCIVASEGQREIDLEADKKWVNGDSLGEKFSVQQPGSTVYANPLRDTAFKIMLGGTDYKVAKSIIRAFVPGFEEKEFEVVAGETQVILPGKMEQSDTKQVSKRSGAMDFRVSSSEGEFVIEMQARRKMRFDERALYYAAYTYVSQNMAEDSSSETNSDWYLNLRPVYAIQFLDYDTNAIKGINVKDGVVDDRDQSFVRQVNEHPFTSDKQSYKHYVMHDRITGQEIERGIHMIQVELPRANRALSPENLKTGYDWWCYLLKHPEKIRDNLGKVEDRDLHEALLLATERLEIVKWNDANRVNYGAEIGGFNEKEALAAAAQEKSRREGALEQVVKRMIISLAEDKEESITSVDRKMLKKECDKGKEGILNETFVNGVLESIKKGDFQRGGKRQKYLDKVKQWEGNLCDVLRRLGEISRRVDTGFSSAEESESE